MYNIWNKSSQFNLITKEIWQYTQVTFRSYSQMDKNDSLRADVQLYHNR